MLQYRPVAQLLQPLPSRAPCLRIDGPLLLLFNCLACCDPTRVCGSCDHTAPSQRVAPAVFDRAACCDPERVTKRGLPSSHYPSHRVSPMMVHPLLYVLYQAA